MLLMLEHIYRKNLFERCDNIMNTMTRVLENNKELGWTLDAWNLDYGYKVEHIGGEKFFMYLQDKPHAGVQKYVTLKEMVDLHMERLKGVKNTYKSPSEYYDFYLNDLIVFHNHLTEKKYSFYNVLKIVKHLSETERFYARAYDEMVQFDDEQIYQYELAMEENNIDNDISFIICFEG